MIITAQKRMFDKTITNSDDFLELPDSSQVLYFHLSMNADDDGFVNNWKSILRMTGTKEDDLKLLITKSFIIPFESGVIVIKHWRINNFLRKDRHIETKFQKELSLLEINSSQEYIWSTNGQPSIDKNRIDKNRIVYSSSNYDELFENFWKHYPKKVDKQKAKEKFIKLKPDKELVELMIKQVERSKDTKEWQQENGKYIPNPSTWLHNKRWEDEFETDSEREERIDREILEGTYGT